MAAKKMCEPCSKAVDKLKRLRGMAPTEVAQSFKPPYVPTALRMKSPGASARM